MKENTNKLPPDSEELEKTEQNFEDCSLGLHPEFHALMKKEPNMFSLLFYRVFSHLFYWIGGVWNRVVNSLWHFRDKSYMHEQFASSYVYVGSIFDRKKAKIVRLHDGSSRLSFEQNSTYYPIGILIVSGRVGDFPFGEVDRDAFRVSRLRKERIGVKLRNFGEPSRKVKFPEKPVRML